jgi:hypothetical protein
MSTPASARGCVDAADGKLVKLIIAVEDCDTTETLHDARDPHNLPCLDAGSFMVIKRGRDLPTRPSDVHGRPRSEVNVARKIN